VFLMPRRNPELTERAHDPYLDRWTPVHFIVGAILGIFFHEFWALMAIVLWEPFVLMVLAPRIEKGRFAFFDRTQLSGPTLRNVLIDLVADVTGVIIGAFVLRDLFGVTPLLGI
jgi:hypothetical protein